MLDKIQMQMLTEVADLHGVPEGAYNIRVNGEKAGREMSRQRAMNFLTL